ncbi:MAG: small basic family protein [Firmicutes bacterium]|nr:small basic family protein [Bacillota bacterium]
MWWIPILGLVFGILIGLKSPLYFPVAYAKYMSVAVLAALDSVFGGLRAGLEEQFDNTIFMSGFFSNTLLAAMLAYIGDHLGVELYMAAIVVFGVRVFQNLAIIRRHLLKK